MKCNKFLIFSLLAVWSAGDVCAQKKFEGSYVGGGLGYGYTKASFGDQTFKGMSLSMQTFTGYGIVSEKKYYGVEGTLGYDSFSKNKASNRLKRQQFFGASFRLGKVLRGNFLPFMRAGVGYENFSLRLSDKPTDHFNAWVLGFGVGAEALVTDTFFIRSEIQYKFATSLPGLKERSAKKPFSLGLKMSAGYKF